MTRHITLSAMFMALSVLFPILFHAVGLGPFFLPMFWPIAISLFFLPFGFAVAVAALSPLISTLITGMPPVSPPIIYIMIAELTVMAVVARALFNSTKLGVFWVLAAGLVASRIVLFFMVTVLASLLGLPEAFTSILWVLRGAPGLLMILVVVPILVRRISHHSVFMQRR
ncbi:MAG: ECF transporter S component [candidate division KSB1 bacterium]|nr:ECF transporter S component [candidate division KSB1 bacterium]